MHVTEKHLPSTASICFLHLASKYIDGIDAEMENEYTNDDSALDALLEAIFVFVGVRLPESMSTSMILSFFPSSHFDLIVFSS